jgi:hypothetical protein
MLCGVSFNATQQSNTRRDGSATQALFPSGLVFRQQTDSELTPKARIFAPGSN